MTESLVEENLDDALGFKEEDSLVSLSVPSALGLVVHVHFALCQRGSLTLLADYSTSSEMR